MSRITSGLCVALIIAVCLAGTAAAQTENLYFGGSAYAEGAIGSVFVHEVEVVNTSGTSETFRMYWLPRNQDNTSAVFVDVQVDPGRATRFENVLFDLFGLTPGAVGSLRVIPSSADLRFNSTVINVSDAGTYGQIMPAVPESAALSENETAYILHLGEDSFRRTNLLCVNTTGIHITLEIDLFSSDGTLLQENVSLILQPFSNTQLNQVFNLHAPVDGFLRLDTATPGGRGICFAAVVDNIANDPRTEPAVRAADAAVEYYVPYVAGTSTEVTDIALFAPDGAATARIDLLRTGIDNTVHLTWPVAVPAGEQFDIVDLIDDVFAHTGTGALRITTTSGEILASSQTATLLAPGERPRSIPPVATEDQMADGEAGLLIYLTETTDFQTDLGAVNTSAEVLHLVFTLHDAAGTVLGSLPLQLLPYSHDQIDGAFTAAGHPNVPDGYATAYTTTPGGSFIAYATVTDLRTDHAYHVPMSQVSWLIFADGFESGTTSRWSATSP
jgi:hypothetical protein